MGILTTMKLIGGGIAAAAAAYLIYKAYLWFIENNPFSRVKDGVDKAKDAIEGAVEKAKATVIRTKEVVLDTTTKAAETVGNAVLGTIIPIKTPTNQLGQTIGFNPTTPMKRLGLFSGGFGNGTRPKMTIKLKPFVLSEADKARLAALSNVGL